jgi:hypothetical protein
MTVSSRGSGYSPSRVKTATGLSPNSSNKSANSRSPSRGAAEKPITLELLFKLLEARGWGQTAKCLQEESGKLLRDNTAKDTTEIVTPLLEENLRGKVSNASDVEREQWQAFAALAEDGVKQGQKMSEVRNLLRRVRDVAASAQKPSMAEMNLMMTRKDAEIRELEIISSERHAVVELLHVEDKQFAKETSDLIRQLETREDEETQARIILTKLEAELHKLSAETISIPVSTQARKIQAVLVDWHDHGSHLNAQVQSLFSEIDQNRDGRLEWNNNEIRTFVREIFKRNDIQWPNWQEPVFYDMYRRADVDRSYSLEFREATNFAKSCFESALALVLTGQSDNGHDLIAEYQHATPTQQPRAEYHHITLQTKPEVTQPARPVAKSAMTYSSGVIINFVEFANVCAPLITTNQPHRARMIRVIESGEHLKATMRTYRECDKDGNGRLTWNNGEIRNFISACFVAHGLTPPHEDQIYNMYTQFDKDKNHYLDMRECLEMVDALFRSTFIVETQVHGSPSLSGRFVQPVPVASPGSSTRVVRQVSPLTQPVQPMRSSSPIAGYPVGMVKPAAETLQVGTVFRSTTTPADFTTPLTSPRQAMTVVRGQSLSPRQHSPRPASPPRTASLTVPFLSSSENLSNNGRISPVRVATVMPTAPLSGTTVVVPSRSLLTSSSLETLKKPLSGTASGHASPMYPNVSGHVSPMPSLATLPGHVTTVPSVARSLQAPTLQSTKGGSIKSVSTPSIRPSGGAGPPRIGPPLGSTRSSTASAPVMSPPSIGGSGSYKQFAPVLGRRR